MFRLKIENFTYDLKCKTLKSNIIFNGNFNISFYEDFRTKLSCYLLYHSRAKGDI
jgi:hypothetical protein